MIWVQSPQWVRWILAIALTGVALWSEFGPDPSRPHPFAIQPIAAGDAIGPDNTELRPVPSGLLDPVPEHGYALRGFAPGEPIVVTGLAQEPPPGPPDWWSIEVDLPTGARLGAEVQLVLVETGSTVLGKVVGIPIDDPLAGSQGAVAIPPESAAIVARAVMTGQVVVLVRSG